MQLCFYTLWKLLMTVKCKACISVSILSVCEWFSIIIQHSYIVKKRERGRERKLFCIQRLRGFHFFRSSSIFLMFRMLLNTSDQLQCCLVVMQSKCSFCMLEHLILVMSQNGSPLALWNDFSAASGVVPSWTQNLSFVLFWFSKIRICSLHADCYLFSFFVHIFRMNFSQKCNVFCENEGHRTTRQMTKH